MVGVPEYSAIHAAGSVDRTVTARTRSQTERRVEGWVERAIGVESRQSAARLSSSRPKIAAHDHLPIRLQGEAKGASFDAQAGIEAQIYTPLEVQSGQAMSGAPIRTEQIADDNQSWRINFT